MLADFLRLWGIASQLGMSVLLLLVARVVPVFLREQHDIQTPPPGMGCVCRSSHHIVRAEPARHAHPIAGH